MEFGFKHVNTELAVEHSSGDSHSGVGKGSPGVMKGMEVGE